MKKLLLLIFCLSFLGLTAQTDTSKKADTKIIFLGHNTFKAKQAITYNSTAIKLGIFDMAYGCFGLHVEHELGSLVSLQVGGGLTGRNYSEAVFADELPGYGYLQSGNNFVNTSTTTYTKETNDLNDYTHRTTNTGFFFSLMPKIYLDEEGMEGYYIGFNYQFRRYNFTASGIDTTLNGIYSKSSGSAVFSDNFPVQEYVNQSIIGVTFGSQYLGEKTAIEFSMTAGFRSISGIRRDIWSISKSDSQGNPLYSYYAAYTTNENVLQFYFDLSCKIGLYWGK